MSTLLFGIQQDKVYLAPADSFALKGRNERDLEKVILSLKNEKRVQRVLLLGLLTEQKIYFYFTKRKSRIKTYCELWYCYCYCMFILQYIRFYLHPRSQHFYFKILLNPPAECWSRIFIKIQSHVNIGFLCIL